MSLWTPGGEHEVPDDRPGGAQPAGFDPDDLDDEQRAQLEAMAEEMAQVRAQLLQVPASAVVANHVMGLYELAAIHLSNQPPNLGEGRVAIDAMAAVVEKLEGRLGENEPVLRDALAQLQLAFVQLKGASAAGADDEDGGDDADDGDDAEEE
ncbi:MAG TPA: hypothetical protein VFG94_10555 [Acidimicrobiales bacterium]|nr:hypothetical protein [Acidimicrobiales bacterium]